MPSSQPENLSAVNHAEESGSSDQASSPPIGDQVMDMLQSVEAQLEKLKNLPRAALPSERDSSGPGRVDQNQVSMLQSQISALEEALSEASVQEEERAGEREHFQSQMEERQVELDSARSMIVQLQAQAPAVSPEEIAGLKDEVKGLQDQMVEREKIIAEQQNHLTQAGEKLTAFSEVLSEQYEQSKGAAAQAGLVKDQKAEIEGLQGKLEAALELVRQESAKQKDAEQVAGQLAEGEQEIERLKSELSEAKESLQQQSSQLESEKQKDSEQHAHHLTERDGEIEQLKGELKKALETGQEESARQADAEKMSGQLAEQDRELESLRAEVEELRAKGDGGGDSDVGESLRSRILELESALKERDDSDEMSELHDKVDALQKELTEARQNPGGNEAEVVKNLRDKAQRIQEVAEHLRHRRSRLKRMRALLKGGLPSTGNVMADLENRSSQMRKVENRHRELIELKASLEASERMMIRRWGRAKAGSIVVWCLVLAIVVAGISWIAAAVYFPPTMAASVTVSAKTRSTSPLTEDESRSWGTWHENFLKEPAFAEAAAKRMKDRKLEQYATASTFSARLQDQLAVDHTKPGEMVLTLSGKGKEETLTVLDVVANTLAKESTRQMGTREGNVWATIRSTGKAGGHMRFASLNSVLIDDQRMTWAGIIFGGAYFATLGLIFLVYSKLVKAKRVFDDEEEAMIRQGDAGTAAV